MLCSPLSKWAKYDENRRVLMKKELERLKAHDSLSKDVFEIVSRSLDGQCPPLAGFPFVTIQPSAHPAPTKAVLTYK